MLEAGRQGQEDEASGVQVVEHASDGHRGAGNQWERLPMIYPDLNHEPDFIGRFTHPRCKLLALEPLALRWYLALNGARIRLIPVWRRLYG
jgi:hypothetical protein